MAAYLGSCFKGRFLESDSSGVCQFTADFISFVTANGIKPLKTKRRPLYLKTQSVPRCKHFSSGL